MIPTLAPDASPPRFTSACRRAIGLIPIARLALAGLFLSGMVLSGVALSGVVDAEVREITWDDLLPEGWIPPSVSVDHFFDAAPAQTVAAAQTPVVAELDGQRIKLPGYLVPITMEGESLKEFLMVPYFGACIHVPPPPPNQVVFVRLQKPVQLADPYGPHWVTGVLTTTLSDTELAEAAYTMAGEAVEVFDWDAQFPDESSDEDQVEASQDSD